MNILYVFCDIAFCRVLSIDFILSCGCFIAGASLCDAKLSADSSATEIQVTTATALEKRKIAPLRFAIRTAPTVIIPAAIFVQVNSNALTLSGPVFDGGGGGGAVERKPSIATKPTIVDERIAPPPAALPLPPSRLSADGNVDYGRLQWYTPLVNLTDYFWLILS